ncbi:MAG TPA: YfiR family protein [Bacteroidia bacterium]|nr:YfiR family protein [Bacteroidia bacterium]
MKLKFLLPLLPALVLGQNLTMEDEYSIKTLFIYNFTKYIEWPAANKKNVFEIDVVGESAILKPLEALARNKKINQKPIIIKMIDAESEVTGDIVFIPFSGSKKLSTVLKQCKGKNALVITEAPNLALKGSAINFRVVEHKIRFELNQAAAKNSGLKFSTELVELSIPVNAQ